jgi:isocitrate dehydrogenase kinase/phosphatase
MERYHYVFVRDRVGRLADAQEFEGLVFGRRNFPEPLLAELAAVAPTAVRPDGDRVLVTHCYTERQLAPLDVYVRTAPAGRRRGGRARVRAVRARPRRGQHLRRRPAAQELRADAARARGVLRLRRADVARRVPLPALPDLGDADEFAPEPSYGVGEHDVFPEEFARFAVPQGPLRDAFTAAHGDLLDPAWWEATQRQVAAGELVETFPYAQGRRLGAR